MDDPYRAIAEYYDLEHDAFIDDLDFYRNLAAWTGGPILDAGCGTGRVAVPLAEAGFAVIGLDASAAMLARARERGAHLPSDRLIWRPGRIAEVEPDGTVRLAIVALNTWNHLIEATEQRAALDRLREWLVPGGWLVLDLASPDLGLIGGPADLVRLLWSGAVPVTGERIMKFESRRTDEARQTQWVTLFYDRIEWNGICYRVVTDFEQRYTFPAEIRALVEQSGLIVDNVYGSYELDPYDAGSERLIVIAQRPARKRRERR